MIHKDQQASFRCRRCGECCDQERDVYVDDIERWIGEGRYDILENVLCYPKPGFCADEIGHPCKDCSKAEKV